jgi:hypothetical protein
MFITNPEILNQDKLYYCKNDNIKKYLIKKGFMYLSIKDGIWIFSKTKKLMDTLKEVS